PDAGVVGGAHGGAPDADAGLAQTLHGLEEDHQSGPFCAEGLPTGSSLTPTGAGRKHRSLRGPFPGQGLNYARRQTTFLGGPLGSLGDSVAFTQKVLSKLPEANRAGGHVL